jgi:DNA polymerase-3 subunit delta
MRSRGLEPSPEAARLLAERVEGNLLAAAQEVEKLVMLYGTGPVDLETVREAVSDSSRYDVFELVDAALLGDAPRVSHILDGLRGEGVEPILVLWALSRELRSMETMASALAGGEGLDRVLSANRVWEKRKPPVRAALQRHGNPRRWQAMLYRGARIDRMVKGVEPGNAWDELLQLALLMAGTRLV